MQVNITARHIELTQALADYVRKKMDKCEKYFDNMVWAQVILSVEKYRQFAEIVIHVSKTTFRAKEESIDLYAAIDLATDKIDKQLKKYKEITKVHRKSKSAASSKSAAPAVLEYDDAEKKKHIITEVKRFDVKPTSIPDAIREMELMEYKFYMFLNSDTSQINVLYKRENGSYGLLEPEM